MYSVTSKGRLVGRAAGSRRWVLLPSVDPPISGSTSGMCFSVASRAAASPPSAPSRRDLGPAEAPLHQRADQRHEDCADEA